MRRSGFRSKLEERVCADLARKKVEFQYEERCIRFTPKIRTYTPDLYFENTGVYVEIKGFFKPSDRSKHLMIKEQYPELDLRFLFSNASNKLSKKSKTTYGMWCDRHGFIWAQGVVIPEGWYTNDG